MHDRQTGKNPDSDGAAFAAEGESCAADVGVAGGKAARKTAADHRRDRAAAKLRENLLRRKQQSRARRAGQADETEGLPAAKTDESS